MNDRPPLWFFLDGAAAFSLSMLVSLIIQSNEIFAEIWGVHFVKELTHQNDGLMAATFLLLCLSTAMLYGSMQMFFAAREAVQRKARARDERMREEGREQGRVQGIEQGRQEGFERGRIQILDLLERRGIELPPDVRNEYLNGSRSKSDQ